MKNTLMKLIGMIKGWFANYWKVMLAAGVGAALVFLLVVGIGHIFSGDEGKDAGTKTAIAVHANDDGHALPNNSGANGRGEEEKESSRGCNKCLGDKKCRYCLKHGSGECDECWGSGEKNCSCFAGDCTKCLGDGEIVVGSKTIRCTGCNGTGSHKKCKGTGMLDCNHCDGRGDCFACDGTGICSICD